MKIKITGPGSKAGYTILSDNEMDWLFDLVGSNPDDDEIAEFCEDENIWDEVKFKRTLFGPGLDCKVFVDDINLLAKHIKVRSDNKIQKLTNITGDTPILTVINDYTGTWFKGEIDTEEFDVKKLTFETTSLNDLEIITKVFYNNKEVINEIQEPLLNRYNSFAKLDF
jgi:hypothetical protein